jgi:predicted alpha/beta superfamily hydrolase
MLTAILGSAENPPKSRNIQTFELHSKVFDNTRTIRVLLPPEYGREGNRTRYPVLYLNDGLMVFDANGPGLNIEKTILDLYQKRLLSPLIVVGIDNGACTDKTKNELVDRADEFLPYPDAGFAPGNMYEPQPPHPHGKQYPDFLINEVMPEINRRYRTTKDPAGTSLGGFSYGGVSALFTVIARPGIFGKLLLESTPLWIGPNYELMNDVRNARQWPLRVYLGAGSRETDEAVFNQEGEKNQKNLAVVIRKSSPTTIVKLVREKGAKHETGAWRRRLSDALQFLFPPD